mmetsp:Transcript_31536/g.94360  ORF Transcript_31536/g.94360 Transcript_31536/m.94360 type:complete len:244 (+) Transcript_31536:3338-4069(+)
MCTTRPPGMVATRQFRHRSPSVRTFGSEFVRHVSKAGTSLEAKAGPDSRSNCAGASSRTFLNARRDPSIAAVTSSPTRCCPPCAAAAAAAADADSIHPNKNGSSSGHRESGRDSRPSPTWLATQLDDTALDATLRTAGWASTRLRRRFPLISAAAASGSRIGPAYRPSESSGAGGGIASAFFRSRPAIWRRCTHGPSRPAASPRSLFTAEGSPPECSRARAQLDSGTEDGAGEASVREKSAHI